MESTKTQGNTAFSKGQNDDALKLYRDALKICPQNKLTNAKLHGNIAAVLMRQKNYNDALKVTSGPS